MIGNGLSRGAATSAAARMADEASTAVRRRARRGTRSFTNALQRNYAWLTAHGHTGPDPSPARPGDVRERAGHGDVESDDEHCGHDQLLLSSAIRVSLKLERL